MRQSWGAGADESPEEIAQRVVADGDVELVRRELHRLVSEGSSRKMQRWGTADALRAFEIALAIVEHIAIPQPWPALVQYRLAHLRMRSATTREDLEAVDELLVSASRAAVIGPWPAIYRLAVLQRLDVSRSRIESAFRVAVESWRRWEATHPTAVDPEKTAPIQGDVFSLLDLAGMFCAIDRSELDGLGVAPHARVLREGTWVVLTGAEGDSLVSMPEDFARAELASRTEARPDLVMFVIDSAGRASWRGPGSRESETITESQAALVLLVLDGRRTRASLVTALFPEGAVARPEDAFRQAKSRVSRVLASAGLDVGGEADLLEIAADGRVRLRAALPVVGACPRGLVTRGLER